MDERAEIEDDEEAEEDAASPPGEPSEAPRKRGRPKGTPKTGGRPSLPKTPADLRSHIIAEMGKAERLLAIARGDELRTSGPTGKSMLAHPSIAEQLKAWELLLKKVLPDLQGTTLDANITGDIKMPEPGTRHVARAVLDILRTANIEKQPLRGPYEDAEVAEAEDTNAAAGEPFPSARSEGGEGGYASPSSPPPVDDALASAARRGGDDVGAASSPPASDVTLEKIKARCRQLGIPYAEEPTHVPFNPNACADECPPPMSAEDKIKARLKDDTNKRRAAMGLPRIATDAWLAETEGLPEEHQRRPGTAASDFERGGPLDGQAKKHHVGDRGHYFQFNGVENGDGRRRYILFDAHGMRFGFAWGHEEATAKIRQLIGQGK